MKTIHVSLVEFLSSKKPWDYLSDTFTDEPEWGVPECELLALRDAMPMMDDDHLACALPIAERSQPHLFAEVAARLLNHPYMSVRVNAYRVLRALRKEDINERLRCIVADYLNQCPEAEHFADALFRT